MAGTETKKGILQIDLKDNASSGIKKIKEESNSVGQSIEKGFKTAAKAVALVTAAATAATAAMITMADRIGGLQEVTAGFNRNFGDSVDALKKMQEASDGMIDNYNLMRIASKAANTGVTTDINKLAGVMKTAQFKADEMGIGFQDMFESLVQGISRGSDMMLTKLGIVIPESLTKSMEKMSETEKTAALLNYVIGEGDRIAGEYGETTQSLSDKVDILKSTLINLKDDALLLLEPIITPILDKLVIIVNYLKDNLPVAIEDAKKKIQELEESKPFQTIKTVLEFIWSFIKEDIGKALLELKNSMTEQLEAMGLDWNFFIEVLKMVVVLIGIVLFGAITAVLGLVWVLIKVFNFFVQIGTDIINGVKNAFAETKREIQEVVTWVENLINKIKGIPNKTAKITAINSEGGGGSFATGGITRGGMTMVHKDELIELPKGSHVYNKEASAKMGGGDIVININAPTYGINDLKSSILEAVNEATAQQNRLANYNLL